MTPDYGMMSLAQRTQVVLPVLIAGASVPVPKPSLHAVFNYLLRSLHVGCQSIELPLEKVKRRRARSV